MQLIIRFWLFIIILIFSSSLYAAQLSPVGYWKTLDDVTERPRAIIQIEQKGNTLTGRIVKTYPLPGDSPVCRHCSGAKHNQPIVGLEIMQGLRKTSQNSEQWTGGEILDPKSGKTYHCNLQVKGDGSRLLVRGYIGLPLLGRTQTWIRIKPHTL